MIKLYSGTPGSGKSLHMAENIYCRLRFGKPVIANFPINLEYIKGKKKEFMYINNGQLRPSYLIAYSKEYFAGRRIKEGEIQLYIDESQLIFNTRDWGQKDRKEWLSFFTQHRKLGYDVILVAQYDRMLDRQLRSVIEYEYIHRKVSNFGIAGKLMSLFCFGKLFVYVQIWYPMREKVGSNFFTAKKKYYRIYDTYADF